MKMNAGEMSGRLRRVGTETLAEALGHGRRQDAVLRRSGGPAGNAVLTAWTGLMLVVLFAAELVTLIGVHQLIAWHLVIGALLVPPALLKTATTGWRIARYYTGCRPYVACLADEPDHRHGRVEGHRGFDRPTGRAR
jgi:hypothetical protein